MEFVESMPSISKLAKRAYHLEKKIKDVSGAPNGLIRWIFVRDTYSPQKFGFSWEENATFTSAKYQRKISQQLSDTDWKNNLLCF